MEGAGAPSFHRHSGPWSHSIVLNSHQKGAIIGPGGRNPRDYGRSFIFLLGSGGNTWEVLRPYRRSMGGSLSPCNSSVSVFIWGLHLLKNWVPPAKPMFLRGHSSQGHGGSADTVGCQAPPAAIGVPGIAWRETWDAWDHQN